MPAPRGGERRTVHPGDDGVGEVDGGVRARWRRRKVHPLDAGGDDRLHGCRHHLEHGGAAHPGTARALHRAGRCRASTRQARRSTDVVEQGRDPAHRGVGGPIRAASTDTQSRHDRSTGDQSDAFDGDAAEPERRSPRRPSATPAPPTATNHPSAADSGIATASACWPSGSGTPAWSSQPTGGAADRLPGVSRAPRCSPGGAPRPPAHTTTWPPIHDAWSAPRRLRARPAALIVVDVRRALTGAPVDASGPPSSGGSRASR